MNIIATFLTLLCISYHCIASDYNLDDLEILHNQENYSEYLSHALDVKPSQRTKKWEVMTEKMGQIFLDEIISNKNITQQQFKLVKTISKWPVFKSNEFFIIKRDKALIKEIDYCYINKQKNCLEIAKTYFKDYKHYEIYPFQMATILQKHKVENKQIWFFIEDFVKAELSEFYCDKESIISPIATKLYNEQTDTKLLTQLINKACLKVMAPKLKKKLEYSSNDNDYYFGLLKHLKMFSKDEIISFELIQFMDNHQSKYLDTKNFIQTLKKLSQDSNKRELILTKFKTIDPIPSRIFKENSKKTIVKTKLLNQYFPEVINYLSKQCLDYFSGAANFKNGSPSLYCHEFFTMASKNELIPKAWTKKYLKYTNFAQKKPLL